LQGKSGKEKLVPSDRGLLVQQLLVVSGDATVVERFLIEPTSNAVEEARP
jgi:hypothetical protein